MIRPAREQEDLSDDEFYEIIEPSLKEINNYLNNVFLYDYIARCIAVNFKNNSIWEDSKLEYEFKDAMDSLANMSVVNRFENFDVEKLERILEKKHSLKITSVNPIRIEEIK